MSANFQSLMTNLKALLAPYSNPELYDLEFYNENLHFALESLVKEYSKEEYAVEKEANKDLFSEIFNSLVGIALPFGYLKDKNLEIYKDTVAVLLVGLIEYYQNKRKEEIK